METLGNASEALELAYLLELGYFNASTKKKPTACVRLTDNDDEKRAKSY